MTVNTSHQPKALPFLCLTELWERFGFYVVQGLLVLYMTQYFGYSDSESYTIMGVFTALAYISPLAGGYIANHVLGYKDSILCGGFLLIIGYVLLSLPYAKTLLHPALATIIVGNGLFKPNISSLLGTQYAANDTKRDAGFTIFYIGINVGAFLAGMSSGYIKDMFGWRFSFALAAIGLIIGVFTFLYGLKYIVSEKKMIKRKTPSAPTLVLGALSTILAINFLLKIETLAKYLLPIVGLLLLIWLAYTTLQQNAEYRKKMILLSILIISSIVYWTLFLQIFYSANLFVDRLVDKTFLGFHLSTTVFYASESLFIMILGPLFAWLWHYLAKNQINPSAINKFMLGIFFAGLGFIVLACSTYFANDEGLISPLWVFGTYLCITIGELLLSPIGLSAITMLAPPQLVSIMMGVWFVATGFGGIFAGWIAQLADVPADVTTVADKLMIYQSAFFNFAYIAFFVAIVLFLIQLSLRKYFRE